MATLLDVSGTSYPAQRNGQSVPALEGTSLKPAFEADAIPDRPMFWEHEGNAAVRVGRWKLLHFYEDDRDELYDLAADPSEQHNLAAADPARTRTLRARLDSELRAQGARLPTPSPN